MRDSISSTRPGGTTGSAIHRQNPCCWREPAVGDLPLDDIAQNRALPRVSSHRRRAAAGSTEPPRVADSSVVRFVARQGLQVESLKLAVLPHIPYPVGNRFPVTNSEHDLRRRLVERSDAGRKPTGHRADARRQHPQPPWRRGRPAVSDSITPRTNWSMSVPAELAHGARAPSGSSRADDVPTVQRISHPSAAADESASRAIRLLPTPAAPLTTIPDELGADTAFRLSVSPPSGRSAATPSAPTERRSVAGGRAAQQPPTSGEAQTREPIRRARRSGPQLLTRTLTDRSRTARFPSRGSQPGQGAPAQSAVRAFVAAGATAAAGASSAPVAACTAAAVAAGIAVAACASRCRRFHRCHRRRRCHRCRQLCRQARCRRSRRCRRCRRCLRCLRCCRLRHRHQCRRFRRCRRERPRHRCGCLLYLLSRPCRLWRPCRRCPTAARYRRRCHLFLQYLRRLLRRRGRRRHCLRYRRCRHHLPCRHRRRRRPSGRRGHPAPRVLRSPPVSPAPPPEPSTPLLPLPPVPPEPPLPDTNPALPPAPPAAPSPPAPPAPPLPKNPALPPLPPA